MSSRAALGEPGRFPRSSKSSFRGAAGGWRQKLQDTRQRCSVRHVDLAHDRPFHRRAMSWASTVLMARISAVTDGLLVMIPEGSRAGMSGAVVGRLQIGRARGRQGLAALEAPALLLMGSLPLVCSSHEVGQAAGLAAEMRTKPRCRVAVSRGSSDGGERGLTRLRAM